MKLKRASFGLVVVDLMSTVADSAPVCGWILSDALRGEGIGVADEEIRNVLGLPLRRAISALVRTGRGLQAMARSQDRVHDACVKALHDHYARLGAVREVEGASRVFAGLRAHGLRLAIVTNVPRSVASTVLESLDWYDRGLVDTVVTCEEVDDPRPQPGMVFEAMRRTAVVESARVMKVGQSPADLAEGTLACCGAVVALTHGGHEAHELRLRPHTHIADRLLAVLDLVAVSTVAAPHSVAAHG